MDGCLTNELQECSFQLKAARHRKWGIECLQYRA